MFREVRHVDPAEAAALLELSTQGVHEEHVARLVALMETAAWKPELQGEAIHVHLGRLRNGHHRLHAILRLGRPVPQLIQTDGADDPRLNLTDEYAYDALGRRTRWTPKTSRVLETASEL